jgi:hypothetical protein
LGNATRTARGVPPHSREHLFQGVVNGSEHQVAIPDGRAPGLGDENPTRREFFFAHRVERSGVQLVARTAVQGVGKVADNNVQRPIRQSLQASLGVADYQICALVVIRARGVKRRVLATHVHNDAVW